METPYCIILGVGQNNKDGLWYARLTMKDPEGNDVINAHIPDGYKTKTEATERLKLAIPDLLKHCRLTGNHVEFMEVV